MFSRTCSGKRLLNIFRVISVFIFILSIAPGVKRGLGVTLTSHPSIAEVKNEC
jgi:hypothetical protein